MKVGIMACEGGSRRMMWRILRPILTSAFLGLTFLGCSGLTSDGERPIVQQERCDSSEIPLPDYMLKRTSNWTWKDISIGNTSERELIEILGEPTATYSWPQRSHKIEACIYRYQEPANYPTFWLAGGKVIGARFAMFDEQTRIDEQPRTFEEARQLYGRAEVVGWNSLGAGYRSIVWLKYGLLVEVFVAGEQQISAVTYFTPLTEEEFKNSLWSDLVPESNPALGSDFIDGYPKDPFDWEVRE